MAATSNAARSPGGSAGFIHGSACAKTIDDDARMPTHAASSVEHADSNLTMSMVSSIHKCCSAPRFRPVVFEGLRRGAQRSDSARQCKVQLSVAHAKDRKKLLATAEVYANKPCKNQSPSSTP